MYNGEAEADNESVRSWGVRPVIDVVHVSICELVLDVDIICKVSGGVVVGGENKVDIENENAVVN